MSGCELPAGTCYVLCYTRSVRADATKVIAFISSWVERARTSVEKPIRRVEKSAFGSAVGDGVRDGFAFTLQGRDCLIIACSEQGCEGMTRE